MQTNKTDKNDTVHKDHKTSPRGMAPDDAHASKATSPGRRTSTDDDTFDSAPENAQSKQTQRLK